MRAFYLMSFDQKYNKRFDTLQELISYYDKHSVIYTHYVFAIPLLGYYRRDELPDVNQPKIREKYKLGLKEVMNEFD